MNVLLISSSGFLGGFGLVLGVLSILGTFQDGPPPASPEFAEFFHQNVEWSSECEAFLDKDGRIYDHETGTLTYLWLGSQEREELCWHSLPPLMDVVFVVDSCPTCPSPPTEVCQTNLRNGSGVEGLTVKGILREAFLGDEWVPPEAHIGIWDGTIDQLEACERYVTLGKYAVIPTETSMARTYNSIAIRLQADYN